MLKYKIDYGYGVANFYTDVEKVEDRFCQLANTCYGIRNCVTKAEIISKHADDRPEERQKFEKLEFSGDEYIWREDGARIMLTPILELNWDTSFCDTCAKKGGNMKKINDNENTNDTVTTPEEPKEFKCDSCMCNPVCIHKPSYMQVQMAIDDLVVNVDGIAKLYDIPWIETPLTVKCKYYRHTNSGKKW